MRRIDTGTGWAQLVCLAYLVSGCGVSSGPPELGNHSRAAQATDEQCYLIADAQMNTTDAIDDTLYILDKNNPDAGSNQERIGDIGDVGVNFVEAIAIDPQTKILYGADGNQLGTINVDTAVFTALDQVFGIGGDGLGNAEPFVDIDGLTFDPQTGQLYGSVRRNNGIDLLIKINKTTGAHIPDAFGVGMDYVPIPAVENNIDIDDIAIDMDGVMYAIANTGGMNDHLVTIDKNSGRATDIGPTRDETSAAIRDVEGLGFDTMGQLWGSAGQNGFLYRIDKATAITNTAVPVMEGDDFEAIDCLTGDLPVGRDAGPQRDASASGRDAKAPPSFDDWSVIGGGCSASSRASGSGAVLAVALAILALVWRRRVRVPTCALVIVTLTTALTWATTETARAQITGEFTLERFRISLDRQGVLDSEWGRTLGHLQWDVGLWLGAADDPLVVVARVDGGDRRRIGSLVNHRVGGNLVATIGLLSRFQVGLETPLILSQDQSIDMSPVGMGGSITRFGLGDIRLVPKVRVLHSDRHFIDLAIIPAFSLPTSTSEEYFGEGTLILCPELAISRAVGAFRLAGNIGYRVRRTKTLGDLTVDDEIFWRIAAGYRLGEAGLPPVEVDLSVTTATRADDFLDDPNNNHLEVLGAVQYLFSERLLGFAAVGVGLNEGFGTPDWRVLIGARFGLRETRQPTLVPPPPRVVIEPPPVPGKCGDEASQAPGHPPDRDCDTVPDPAEPGPGQPPGTDYCPDQPGLPAYRGCPEPTVAIGNCEDIDISPPIAFAPGGDVLMPTSVISLDALARALKENHPDARVSIEIGSASADRDLAQRRASAVMAHLIGQGVNPKNLAAIGRGTIGIGNVGADQSATANTAPGKAPTAPGKAPTAPGKAPTAPGKAPTAPGNAVPGLARPGDAAAGVAAAVDESLYPAAFRVLCPEKDKAPCKNVELSGKIEFDINSDVIKPASIELLKRDVVWVLDAHRDVHVIVEGHTSSEGRRAYNMALSQRRAEAVITYLTGQGIDAGRLEAAGYGPRYLLIKPEKSEADRRKNRRIEFRIIRGGSCPPCEKFQVGKIQFHFNSNRIKPESLPELDRLVRQLGDRRDVRLRIEGHTSSEGRALVNKRLSQRRAAAVRQYLIKRGVARNRLTSQGIGEAQLLIKPDDTEEKREKNRRVEFKITRGGDCAGQLPNR
ncbi:MAG: OmpA family protein [Proteobacteria bacterium]|nr:OmpA family protein [Pseudomonadota bacterium]